MCLLSEYLEGMIMKVVEKMRGRNGHDHTEPRQPPRFPVTKPINYYRQR
jgi:hypothetical protein